MFSMLLAVLLSLFPAGQAEPGWEGCKNWVRDLEADWMAWRTSEIQLGEAKNAAGEAEAALWQSRALEKRKTLQLALGKSPGHAFCRAVGVRGRSLLLGQKPMGDAPQAVQYLQEEFLDARVQSGLRWRVWAELFGAGVEETFLRESFAGGRFLASVAEKNEPRPLRLIFVSTPLAPENSREEFQRMAELYRKKTAASSEYFPLTAFASLEDQARELHNHLFVAVEDGKLAQNDFVLVSSGIASAVVYRMLDLYPEWRQQPRIAGWLNYNGLLYGQTHTRAPASAKGSPAFILDRIAAEQSLAELDTPLPLGKGFPVVNLVEPRALGELPSLRAAIVFDGDTILLEGRGKSEQAVETGLRRLAQIRP